MKKNRFLVTAVVAGIPLVLGVGTKEPVKVMGTLSVRKKKKDARIEAIRKIAIMHRCNPSNISDVEVTKISKL